MTTTETDASMSDTASTRVGDSEIVELLDAYQFLQGQNIRMATSLSNRFGISAHDLRVLLYLDAATDVSPKDVGTKLEQSSGSITPLLDRLEKSGHIVRRAHPSDRRGLTLHLTESGHTVAVAIRNAYRDAFSNTLTSTEIAQATPILRALGLSLAATTSDTPTRPFYV
jgi:DNA-binding MarR family transcriptional regulator